MDKKRARGGRDERQEGDWERVRGGKGQETKGRGGRERQKECSWTKREWKEDE